MQKTAKSLLRISEIKTTLLMMSDYLGKVLDYFTEKDKNKVVLNLIKNFS
jgi:hypothetical protein